MANEGIFPLMFPQNNFVLIFMFLIFHVHVILFYTITLITSKDGYHIMMNYAFLDFVTSFLLGPNIFLSTRSLYCCLN
jgi:hypothetical protein